MKASFSRQIKRWLNLEKLETPFLMFWATLSLHNVSGLFNLPLIYPLFYLDCLAAAEPESLSSTRKTPCLSFVNHHELLIKTILPFWFQFMDGLYLCNTQIEAEFLWFVHPSILLGVHTPCPTWDHRTQAMGNLNWTH